jgi:hypothetical protein
MAELSCYWFLLTQQTHRLNYRFLGVCEKAPVLVHRNVHVTIKWQDWTPLALSNHDHSFLQEASDVEPGSPDDQADQKLSGQLLKPNNKFLVQKWTVS